MDFNLEGKTVAITGSSEGIGKAIALQLAALGCNLRLAARTAANLDKVKEEVRGSANVAVETYPLDLSKSENQQAFAKACVDDCDILVNNAGAIPGGRIDEIDEATWRAAWDLKVFGYINITREFYAAMKKRGAGVILNIIGTGGEKPMAADGVLPGARRQQRPGRHSRARDQSGACGDRPADYAFQEIGARPLRRRGPL
jgi:3-oxoacyl-[acyl-carrier protein] reductase